MNKECFADIIELVDPLELNRNTYIRCLMDGTMTEIKPKFPLSFTYGQIPKICPNCKRPIILNREKIIPETRIIKQFYLSHFNTWINFPN